MELVYSEKLRFTMSVWNRICIQVSEAIKFMHYSNILHTDIKSNNIILKVMNKDEDICPKICDFGKATHKMKPLQYNLTDKEKLKYNAKYLYIAYELRNLNAFQTIYSDIYSLGYSFSFIAGDEKSKLHIIGKRMSVDEPLSRPTINTVIKFLSDCNE